VLLLPQTESTEAERIVSRSRPVSARLESEKGSLVCLLWLGDKESDGGRLDLLLVQAEDNMYHAKLVESTDMKNETIRLACGSYTIRTRWNSAIPKSGQAVRKSGQRSV